MRLLLVLLPLLMFISGARAELSWTNVGPGGGGWIQSLAADPRDANTIYLGCDVGGFYVSLNGGATWSIFNTGLGDYFVECIAVHPRDRFTILLGTEGGIYKSIDDAPFWRPMRAGFPAPQRHAFSAPIGAIAFDNVKPNIVYAGIGRPRWNKEGKGQIYKSTDTGESWTLCTPPGALDASAIVSDIEVAPDSSYVLAATSKGVYRSDDGGANWAASSNGLPHLAVGELAIAPSQPRTVYCTMRTMARDEQAWNGGVFRSDDGGRTWQKRSEGLATRVGKSGEASQMTSNYREIAVDPRDAETVYAGDWSWVTAGLYKTSNGGRSWQRVTEKSGDKANMDYGWITQWGTMVESLALSAAAPEKLWFGTSGHVFATQNGGARWEQRYCRINADGSWQGNGLEVTCLNQVLPDPHRPERVLFGFMDLGLMVSDQTGQRWNSANIGMKFRNNTFTVAFDPTNAETMWAGTGEWGANHGDICLSSDGGRNWKPVGTPQTGLPDGQVRTIIVDPTSPVAARTLYATSSGNGVFKSTDGGASWKPTHDGLPETARKQPRGLVMNPRDAKHLRLALSGTSQNGGGIWETRDGGTSWMRLSGDVPLSDIQELRADPFEFDTLYVAQRESLDRAQNKLFPGGLYKSRDGGKTWMRVFDFHFVDSIVLHPTKRGWLYVGTNDHPFHDNSRATGVWQSVDGGHTWTAQNRGMTHSNITSLAIANNRIWAGTAGNALFVANLE